MSDFEETWNADMRAALSGLLVEESLFSALDNSVLDTNAKHGYFSDDEKTRRVQKAFAYADLCAEERRRRWRLEKLSKLQGARMNPDLMSKFKVWSANITNQRPEDRPNSFLISLGMGKNVATLIERQLYHRLWSLSSLRTAMYEHFSV